MSATANAFRFTPATKAAAKLRAALFGPSGSGKTFSALRIASGLGGAIAVIDTERGSASKYADRFRFDVLELTGKTIPEYEAAIDAAAQAGYPVLIIDSLSHAWQELLQEIDRLASAKYKGNTWSAWSEGTPKQRGLVDAILNYPGHLLATMRSKTEWVQETTTNGKARPVRIGLSPEQGKGIEYEFDLLLELSPDHIASVIKDRSGRFQDVLLDKPGEQFGAELATWLSDAPATAPDLRLVGARGASNAAGTADSSGEPIRWVTPAQHRRLEGLLKEAGLPRERVREWLANRHPEAYPDGVHLNRIWLRHAEEIERNIPRFAEALQREQEEAEQARQGRIAARDEALDWAADQFGWKGDLAQLARIAAEQAEKAAGLHRAAQHKDGALNRAEVAEADRLAERARLLREFVADAHARQATARQPTAANH